MRNDTKLLSLSMSNVKQLNDAEKANIKGGLMAADLGCPPPIGVGKPVEIK